MKNTYPLIFLLLLIVSCSGRYRTSKKISELIPSTANIVVKVNALNDFKNTLNANSIFSMFDANQLSAASNILNLLNTTEELLIAINTSTEKQSQAFITKNIKGLIALDSISKAKSELYISPDIYKTIYNKDTLYHRVIDSLFFGSKDLELVKQINTNTPDPKLEDLLATSDSKKTASYVFKGQPKTKGNLFLSTAKDISLSEYSSLDFNFENNSILYNGITKSTDSLHLVNAFKNTIPQAFKLAEIIPADITSIKRIAFDDYLTFNTNKAAISNGIKDSIASVLSYTNEVGSITAGNQQALAIYGIEASLISETLISEPSLETFKAINIYAFDTPQFFNERLSPFIDTTSANFFFVIENFAVFSNSIDFLKSIITDKLNNVTLANFEAFKSILVDLADESSYFIYKNEKGLEALLGKNPRGCNTNAVQFIYDSHFAHVNGVIKAYKKRGRVNSVTEEFTVTLQNELLSTPQTVKNHITKAHDILVQDVNNSLYLISSNGNILWKKQLQGKVLGKVEQIDGFKNGRLQLAFATANRVFLMDRNGKDVGLFPLKFKDEITQPLSVFDYDNNKKYRLLVTQNNSLLMYDAKGKKVSGFKYKKAQNTISTPPKHFRIGAKDFIVFTQGQKLEILNRQGQQRVTVKDQIKFSKNAVYLYQNKFTTTNTKGELAQVDTKGRVNLKPLNLEQNHSIDATSKTLVSLSDNKLKIKSRTVDLDFGDYTAPVIFYLNDKIYVSTTDLQSKKVYVFDSQAKLLPSFPVYGTSSAELQNLDKSRGLELITQSDAKTISVYKLN